MKTVVKWERNGETRYKKWRTKKEADAHVRALESMGENAEAVPENLIDPSWYETEVNIASQDH